MKDVHFFEALACARTVRLAFWAIIAANLSGCGGSSEPPLQFQPTEIANAPSIPSYTEKTNFANFLAELPSDVVYVNIHKLMETDVQTLRTKFHQGNRLFLDATDAETTQATEISKLIVGIGAESPVTLVSQPPSGGSPIIEIFDTSQKLSAGAFSSREREVLGSAISKSLSRMLEPERRKALAVPAPASNSDRIPIRTVTLIVNSPSFSCTLNLRYATAKIYGSTSSLPQSGCSQASAELFYQVDLMRSLRGNDGSAENARYVRISSLGPNSGGAGIHISDYLLSQKSSFGTAYEETIGPFASKYSFSVQTDSRKSGLSIAGTSPSNENSGSSISVINSTTIGFFGVAEVGSGGVAAGPGVSYSFASTRQATVDRNEYSVVNSTVNSLDLAQWTWDRNLDANLCLMSPASVSSTPASNCQTFNWNLDQNTQVVDPLNISPISYANFLPAFSVTYKNTNSDVGASTTTFNIISDVEISAISSAYMFSQYKTGYSYITRQPLGNLVFSTRIAVDWDSNIFSAFPFAALGLVEKVGNDNLCLTVFQANFVDGQPIIVYKCTPGSINQSWARTPSGQLISAGRKDDGKNPLLCASAQVNSEAIILKPCDSYNSLQGWDFSNGRVQNRYTASGTIAPRYLTSALQKSEGAYSTNWGQSVFVVSDGNALPNYFPQWKKNWIEIPLR